MSPVGNFVESLAELLQIQIVKYINEKLSIDKITLMLISLFV
jgi:hypothetical protein